MKKGILAIVLLCLSGFTQVFATSSLEAFEWAYKQNLITLNNGLYSSSNVKREEFAPILLSYIEKYSNKRFENWTCRARDLNNSKENYRNEMEKLCSYGILNWENNSLYPAWKLTNGQAVVLIMRILNGKQDESTIGGKHWAQNYFDKAEELGFQVAELKKIKNAPISYENLIHFLYSTQHPNQKVEKADLNTTNTAEIKNSEDALKKLSEIMMKS